MNNYCLIGYGRHLKNKIIPALKNINANIVGVITSQNINLMFAAVGMFNSTRAWYRKNIDNYIEIYIKANLQNIIKLKKKNIYHKKNISGEYFTKIEQSVEYDLKETAGW